MSSLQIDTAIAYVEEVLKLRVIKPVYLSKTICSFTMFYFDKKNSRIRDGTCQKRDSWHIVFVKNATSLVA